MAARALKILLVAEFYEELGGTSEVVENLALRLNELGHQVEVVSTRSTHPGVAVSRSPQVRCTYLAIRGAKPLSLRNPVGFLRAPLEARLGDLAHFIRRFRPDVVNSHVFRWDKMPAVAAACRAAGAPLVQMLYDPAPLGRGRMGDKALNALSGAAGFAANSEATRRFFSRYIPQARGARVIIGGVEASAIAAAEPLRRARPYLFCACRLNLANKSVDLLMEAFAKVAPGMPDFDLVLAGRGPDEPCLREEAARLGLERRVEFAGLVDREKLYALYRGAAAFAMPSRGHAEGLGLGFLEAMAAGVPVIGTDSGGPGEVIKNGVNGFLIQEEDAATLAEAIAALLSDPEKRRLMGEQGRAMVEANWTWRRFAEQYVELYAACL